MAEHLDAGTSGERVVAGSVLRVAAYAAGSLLAVVSTSVVARELGAARFDGFATVLSLSLVALLVTDFGMSALGVREYVALNGAERDRAMAALLALRLALMLFGATAMVGFALVAGFSHDLVFGSALAGAGLVVAVAPATYSVPLLARLRLGMVGAVDLLRQAVQAVLLVVLALSGAGVVPLLATSIPAGAAAAVLGAIAARGLAPLVPRVDLRAMVSLFREALTFAVATSVGATYAYVAQIVAHVVTNPVENGRFSLGFRVFVTLVAVAPIAVGSAFPVLTRAAATDVQRFRYIGSRLYEAALLLGLVIALGIGLGAPAVVAILGGDNFIGATPMLRMLTVALPGSFLVATGSFLLLSLRRHRALLGINTAGLVLVVGLTAALGSRQGGLGAAEALVVTEYALAISYAVALRVAGVAVQPSRRLVVSCAAGLAAAAAVGAVVLGSAGAALGGLAAAVVTGIACPLVFVLTALAAGGVPSEVTDVLRERLLRRGPGLRSRAR
jgi:O-antigen/teichoic acid export membrane protein